MVLKGIPVHVEVSTLNPARCQGIISQIKQELNLNGSPLICFSSSVEHKRNKESIVLIRVTSEGLLLLKVRGEIRLLFADQSDVIVV